MPAGSQPITPRQTADGTTGGYGGVMAPTWMIQPSGARFDPPIEVRIPNSINLKPGETREIYQWDHDIATFVPMGRATVSEDGALLVTDAGSGVTKAGWGGPQRGPPDRCVADGGTPKCNECEKVNAGQGDCPKKSCEANPAQDRKRCRDNACYECKGGTCGVKFSESRDSSVSKFNFPNPAPSQLPCRVPTDYGCFRGFEDQDPLVKMKFELTAYCDKAGSWAFRLTKADWQTVISSREPAPEELLTDAVIDSMEARAGYSTCTRLKLLDQSVRCTARSRFSQKGCSTYVGYSYFRKEDTVAHERVHFSRFRDGLNGEPFATFVAAIEAIRLPLTDYVTAEVARSNVLGSVTFLNAKKTLINSAVRVNAAEFDHPNPSEYETASISALQPWLTRIANRRATLNCPN